VKLIHLLWSGRNRRREPSASVQERVALYTAYPPPRNVTAAPIKPPVKDKRNG
jgi:hypothetical protein